MGKESDLIRAVKHNDANKVQKLMLPDKGYAVKKTDSRVKSTTIPVGGKIRVQLGHLDINCHERDTEYTPLIIATLNGFTDLAETLVFHSADVNAKDSKGNTAVHMAVFNDQLELLDLFIQNGAQVNCQNNDRNTPLHVACQNEGENRVRILYKLLDAGALGDKENKAGLTPLDIAAMFNKKDIVSVLFDHSPHLKSNMVAIVEGAIRGNQEIVELLLDYGIDPNGICALKGTGPLHEAVRFFRFEVCRMLLEFGANPLLKNTKEENPESIAKELPQLKCDKFLKLFKDSENVPRRVPRFSGQNNVFEVKQSSRIRDFPALPNKIQWTDNTPQYCSSCTEKNPNTRILDDNLETFWVIPSVHHAWTVLDLQENHLITGITIYGWNSPQMVKSFQVQKSDDLQGPWVTVVSCTCQLLGSTDPKEPGVPQTFNGFEAESRFIRLYIQDNHGGSCICFQGIQLRGAECRVLSVLDSCGVSHLSDTIVKQGANTFHSLLKLTDDALKDMVPEKSECQELCQKLLELREAEFPATVLEWLRAPVCQIQEGEMLPDFSVQSDPLACEEIEVLAEGAELAGNTKVRLVPGGDDSEASVAIFTSISIKPVGLYHIMVKSSNRPDISISAPDPIEVCPARRAPSEINAAFDEIQNMLNDMQISLDIQIKS